MNRPAALLIRRVDSLLTWSILRPETSVCAYLHFAYRPSRTPTGRASTLSERDMTFLALHHLHQLGGGRVLSFSLLFPGSRRIEVTKREFPMFLRTCLFSACFLYLVYFTCIWSFLLALVSVRACESVALLLVFGLVFLYLDRMYIGVLRVIWILRGDVSDL